MVIKGTDVIGIKIYSSKESSELGQVKDLVYDPKKNKVEALIVRMGESLSEAQVLPLKKIKEFSKDLIMVKSQKSIKPANKVFKPTQTSDGADSVLQSAEIKDDKGQMLGTFHDIYFDTDDGKVTDFEVVAGNQTDKKVTIKNVISSGEDVTIIKERTEEDGGMMSKLKGLMTK